MRGLKRVEGINVVPLIDVVLVLLAIVLTVSTFVVTGHIKLNLPNAASAQKMQLKSIDISILGNGEIYFGEEKIAKESLEQKISTLSKEDMVSIKGDKKSAFEDFVLVMDKLKAHGMEKISIVAKNND